MRSFRPSPEDNLSSEHAHLPRLLCMPPEDELNRPDNSCGKNIREQNKNHHVECGMQSMCVMGAYKWLYERTCGDVHAICFEKSAKGPLESVNPRLELW